MMEQQQYQEESQQLTLQTYLYYFGQNVSTLCDQESDCQISPEDVYDRIRNLWLELKNSQPEIINYLEDTKDN